MTSMANSRFRRWRTAACAALCGVAATSAAAADDEFASARAAMARDVAAMARGTASDTGRATFSPRVMDALARVPRHRFVPESLAARAHENVPLPIGQGQTISQPYIVALSTDLLELEPSHRVLEVGTGSGYQAAVLAELAREVYSIEIVEALGRDAGERLASLGYRNVHVRIGDGWRGWPEHAPFDRILVTAAAPDVPAPLVDQLAADGRMVIPLGSGPFGQQLALVEKRADGSVMRTNVLPVRFVPFTGPGARGR